METEVKKPHHLSAEGRALKAQQDAEKNQPQQNVSELEVVNEVLEKPL